MGTSAPKAAGRSVRQPAASRYELLAFRGKSNSQLLADLQARYNFLDYKLTNGREAIRGKDFFFFANPTDCHLSAEISFKPDKRRKAELWNPHTGKIEKLKYRTSDGRTWITLPLAPMDSRFIVLK